MSHSAMTRADGAPSFVWLAVYSMWLRELVRFWRQKSRLVGAVATPLVFWLVLGAGFGRSFRPDGGLEGTGYLEYFFPGIVTLTVLFTAIYSTISVIEDRQQGFLQGVLVAPVSRAAVVLGKMLGGTTLALIEGALMMLLAPLTGIAVGPVAVVFGIVVLFLIAFGLTGLGLMIAWSMDSTSGFHAIMNLVLMPMWLVSGAVFPFDQAHPIVRAVMIVNPLTYGLAGFRQAIYSSSNSSGGEFLALWLCLLVTSCFAALTMLASFKLADRRSESGR